MLHIWNVEVCIFNHATLMTEWKRVASGLTWDKAMERYRNYHDEFPFCFTRIIASDGGA